MKKLTYKYKAKLYFLQSIYGENATAEEINKKNEEIKGAKKRRWKQQNKI